MTSELKVVINGDGSGAARALGLVSQGVTGLGGIITGGLSVAFGNILTPVLQNLQGVFGSFLTEAMDAQNNLAGLDAVLRATGQAAADQAAEWEAAQGKIVTTSGLSKEKIDELSLAQRQLLNQIAGTTDGLAKLAAENGTDNTVYQEGALKLEVLKNKLAEVNTQLEAGQPRAVSLANALGLTPPAAQMSREELLDLSMQLRDLAKGSDDAVLSVETILLRMGVAKDVFPDATKTVLDVAAALKMDLGSAATLVGKTLLAPGEGLTKLKVAGATFTKQQDEMLKKLVDAGKTAEAQKFILDTLAETMGGTAAEQAKTFSGQLEIARNHLLEIAEGVGTKFLPILQDAFATVTPLIDQFGGLIQTYLPVVILSFQNLAPSVEKFAGTIANLLGLDFSNFDLATFIQGLVVNFGLMMNQAGQFLDWLSVQLPGALATAQTFFQPIIDAVSGLVSAFIDSLPQMQETGAGMMKTLTDVFAAVSPEIIANIAGAITQLTTIWQTHGDTILAVVKVAWDGIVLTIGGALTLASGAIQSGLILISGIMDSFSQLFKGNWQGAWDALVLSVSLAALNILNAINVFFESVAAKMGTSMDEIRLTWKNNWDLAIIIVTQTWQNIKDGVATKVMEMTSGLQTSIINLVNWLKGMVPTFLEIGSAWFVGMTQGILLKVTMLQDAVVSSIKDTIAKAREALGIASPSKVFADIGEQMMAGMAVGLSHGVDMPTAAIATNTSALTQAVAMGGGAGGGNPPLTINISHYLDGQAVGRTTVDGTLKALAERGVDIEGLLAVGT